MANKPLIVTPEEQRALTAMRDLLQQLANHARQVRGVADKLHEQFPAMEKPLHKMAPGNLRDEELAHIELLSLLSGQVQQISNRLDNKLGMILNKLEKGELHVTKRVTRKVVSGG